MSANNTATRAVSGLSSNAMSALATACKAKVAEQNAIGLAESTVSAFYSAIRKDGVPALYLKKITAAKAKEYGLTEEQHAKACAVYADFNTGTAKAVLNATEFRAWSTPNKSRTDNQKAIVNGNKNLQVKELPTKLQDDLASTDPKIRANANKAFNRLRNGCAAAVSGTAGYIRGAVENAEVGASNPLGAKDQAKEKAKDKPKDDLARFNAKILDAIGVLQKNDPEKDSSLATLSMPVDKIVALLRTIK